MQIDILYLDMKKLFFTISLLFASMVSLHAIDILTEGFEYANHDEEIPLGWTCDDASWLCGYLEKDHNRMAHTGNWYAYTNANESWMFMPLYHSNMSKYRYSFWGISDGSFEVEIWVGNDSSPESMTMQLFTVIVDTDVYDRFYAYIETINGNYDYFGIHAVAAPGAYHLSIDDINVEMVEKYAFHAIPAENDTVMHAGAQATFNCKIKNDGYEPLNVTMTPYTEYFTDIHFYIDGQQTNTFPIVQDEVVVINGVATLLPDIEPGTRCWFDVMFTIDCGCATTMFTYWATVDEGDGVNESYADMCIYPNPSKGNITIEGHGTISVFNILGQEVLKKEVVDKETVMLEPGIYFVRKDDNSVQKIIVEF